MNSIDIRKLAKKKVYECKESAYGKETDASNKAEGDFGDWQDWEDVLVDFAREVLASKDT